MGLISSGIERVRVFELPGGIRQDGESIAANRTVLVKWRSSWDDKFYQVYVNGRYAGTTIESGRWGHIVVQIPTSLEGPVRIEVFAVSEEDADRDFSRQTDSAIGESGRVKISMLRSQVLPVGTAIQVYCDNGTGQIDYENPLNDLPIRVWPAWQDKAGFGMSRFGAGDFGWDSAAAVGFGKGLFGMGQFGLDADSIEWISGQMQAGVYKFVVRVIDEKGNEGDSSETGEITVIPAARPAERLSIFSFDKQTNRLIFNIGRERK